MKKLLTTPRIRKLLELAEKIARERKCSYVGSEHLILALFRHREGVGWRMLEASGVDEDKAVQVLEDWNTPGQPYLQEIEQLKARIVELESKQTKP